MDKPHLYFTTMPISNMIEYFKRIDINLPKDVVDCVSIYNSIRFNKCLNILMLFIMNKDNSMSVVAYSIAQINNIISIDAINIKSNNTGYSKKEIIDIMLTNAKIYGYTVE